MAGTDFAASLDECAVVNRAAGGEIVAGPITFDAALKKQKALAAAQPDGDFWIATHKEAKSGVVSY